MEIFSFEQKTIRHTIIGFTWRFQPVIERYNNYPDQCFSDSILTNNYEFPNLQDASLGRITHFLVFQRIHKCSKIQGMWQKVCGNASSSQLALLRYRCAP